MNYLIGHALNENKVVGQEPGINKCGSNQGINYQACTIASDPHSLHNTSLPWEILEAAHSLFLKKGFERTSVTDICRRLEIKPFEFHSHFNSLDEVLEILWER